jgi:uncharacterized protein YkwD
MKKNNARHLLIFFLSALASAFFSVKGQENKKSITELIIRETNLLRVEKKLPELKPLDTLMNLAQYHSENMVKHKFYSHVDHQGLDPVERAEKQKIKAWVKKGNNFFGIAENIAKTPWFENVIGCGDTRSPETFSKCVVKSWKESPPHYKNILGNYTYIGVGISFDENGNGFSTQNFR